MQQGRQTLKAMLVVGLLLVQACTGSAIPVVDKAAQLPRRQAVPVSGVHTVRPGETLYSIAWKYSQDYKRLARNNRIAAPYTIRPGQRLYLRTAPGVSKPVNVAGSTGSGARQPAKAKPLSTVPGTWRWPAEGKLLAGFDSSKGRKGIDIAGKPGQSVYSTRAGRVVYSGNGIRGYGNLLIVKHGPEFLSAYAYNSRLLVKEGDTVKEGQKIAEIGSSGAAREAKLHFEIRKSGKPVNPISLLPKRG